MTEPRRLTDPDMLKGLTHPMRRRLYRLLLQLGPATATLLGEHIADADPGQLSYHLRELGRRGFIEEAPELARDRRERWWRVVPGAVSWSAEQFTDPADRAVADTVYRNTVADQFERLSAFEAVKETWPAEWATAAITSNNYLRLTPEELRTLSEELHQLLRRWSALGRIDPGTRPEDRSDDGRENVFLFLHAFPEKP
ncbi:helix-turn-helix domain-containing protein [Kitasatospora sp. GP82]|uniref:helix-turn-helix domain-containing protein n=1 Tax=Kitasatospora sp. GP82 TaxID=3035089 RepID=UPI002473B950|nr:helix-turn-helix domain-containing protein [Kitasatospora sp. GP82]MDH6126868.1 DNA-binding transcriptional ArsR family regulator [Kitasatospora sp. GP82]